MTLTDGAVASLAGQAADLIEPGLPVRVAPAANDDPYRWGSHGWIVTIDAGVELEFWISSDASPAEALRQFIDHLDEVSETERYWGRAVPGCPGHRHMAEVAVEGEDVVLRCPATGKVVQRIHPDV
jgi:hypothetical protein